MSITPDFTGTSRYPFLHAGSTAQITPFTLRDGVSYLEKLERLAHFVDETLRGEFKEIIERAISEFNSSMDRTGEAWTTEFRAYMKDVNASLMALNDKAMATLIDMAASETGGAIRDLIEDMAPSREEFVELDASVNRRVADLDKTVNTRLTDVRKVVDDHSQRHEWWGEDRLSLDVRQIGSPVRDFVRTGLKNSPFEAFRIFFAGDSHTNDGSLEQWERQPDKWGGGTGYSYRLANLMTNVGISEAQSGVNAGAKYNPGVHFWESATGGMRSDGYLSRGAITNVGNIRPHFLTHLIGTNDFAGQVPVSAFKANVERAIAEVWRVSPDTRQMIIVPWPRSNPDNMLTEWREYADALRAIGKANEFDGRFELFDYGSKFERLSSPLNPNLWGILPDGIHGNRSLHRDLTEDIAVWMGLPSPMAVFGPTRILQGTTLRPGTLDNENPHSTLRVEKAPVPRWATFHINLVAENVGGETDIVINEHTDTTVGAIGEFYPFHVQPGPLQSYHFTRKIWIPSHAYRIYYLSGGKDIKVLGGAQYEEYNDFSVELNYA